MLRRGLDVFVKGLDKFEDVDGFLVGGELVLGWGIDLAVIVLGAGIKSDFAQLFCLTFSTISSSLELLGSVHGLIVLKSVRCVFLGCCCLMSF